MTRLIANLLVLLGLLVSSPTMATEPSLFTEHERQWISDHPIIEFAGYPDWQPFESVHRGKVSGLSLEYLGAISRISGLTFRPVLEPDIEQARAALAKGKLDLLPVVTAHNSGADAGNPPGQMLSSPYFVGTAVIITRDSMPNIYDLSRLQGRHVAVREHGIMHRLLQERYPDISLLPMSSPEQELQAVSDGMADAAIDIDALLMPLWRRGYYKNLHVSGTVNDALLNVRMRVRDDEPELRSIIDKSLASLTAKQTDDMMARWMIDSDYGAPSWTVLLRFHSTAFIGISAALALLAVLYFFARRDHRRAIRSERDKAMFLATMSHEIRLPTSALLSSVELLRSTRLDTRQSKIVDAATTSADALLRLIDNVLDISKLEVNGLKLERLPVNLRKIADDVVNVVLHKASEKHIPVHVDLNLRAGHTVMTDPTRLQQVLINLLSNAIKFTTRGSVTLEMTLHPNDGAELPAQLTVRVKDTGIGIAANRRHQLFQAYVQADSSIQRRYGGTGLGLNICRQLVELMGGTIALTSEVGEGTTASFMIPVTIVDPADLRADSPHAPSQAELPVGPIQREKRPSILLVEDHPANRFVIEQQLRSLQCSVLIAENGSTALDMIEQHSFDLVMLDCNLPDMDGYEVTRQVRQREAPLHRHTPVVAMSASSNAVHKMACIECGMDGVLTKPLQLAVLKAEIALWCGFDLPVGSDRAEFA
jgi:two-component system, NarL family, sensor histidine kinase EvgS